MCIGVADYKHNIDGGDVQPKNIISLLLKI